MLAVELQDRSTLDPWRTWVTFKRFSRMVAEIPDPGVSVQIQQHAKGLVRLYFMHQAVTEEGEGWLEPAGGVVCELTFQMRVRLRRPVELWTFDYPDFGRFVDGVEQHRAFTDLTVRQPVQTAVYWEEA